MLTARFRYILDASFNSDDSDALSMTEKLDFLERRLYEEVRMFHFTPEITFINFNFSGPEEPAPAPPLVPAADRPPTRLRHGAEAQEEEGGRSMNN